MVQLRSMLKVADNTGAKIAQMIGLPSKGNRKKATVGMIVKVVVKKADPQGSVKKSEVVSAVIVRTRKEVRRADGSYIRFDDNACVILDGKTNEPKGTRVFGPISREVKQAGFNKIASLATEMY